jgi:tRNA A-37 threonylcarbamoyl transferase component Bud32
MEDLGERHLVTELKAANAVRARNLLRQAGVLMARLHASLVFHKDLKVGNFMVAADAATGGDRVTVIDLDAVRFDYDLAPGRKARNLGQFLEGFNARFGLPPVYNRWFLAAYRREFRMPRREFRKLLAALPAE